MKWALWVVTAALVWAALSWLAHHGIFFPMRYPQGWWDQKDSLGAEDVWLSTADGTRIHAWWAAVPGAQVATLFLHGNAGNVSHRGRSIRRITAAGSSVLAIDYRGYGRSEGSPSERGITEDASAAYQWLAERSERVVVHGESLGTAVAIELASRTPVHGLILEAPFPSARAVAGTVLPWLGPLLVWGFDSKSRIARVQAPILVIHGDRDEVIPLKLGRDLFEAANQPKDFWLVPGAGHNDLLEIAGQPYTDRLRSFYATLR